GSDVRLIECGTPFAPPKLCCFSQQERRRAPMTRAFSPTTPISTCCPRRSSAARSAWPRADVHFVVAADNRHLIAALQLGHGALRHQQRPRRGANGESDPGILTRTQRVIGIGKQGRNADRAGARVPQETSRCADMQSWHSSGFLPDNLQLGAYGAARERMHATAPPATTGAPIANTRRRPIS